MSRVKVNKSMDHVTAEQLATPVKLMPKHAEADALTRFETTVPVLLATDRQPWERQPREALSLYQYFKIFLEMDPPRTIRGAYLYWHAYVRSHPNKYPLGKHTDPKWWTWAKQWRWRERAEAWDAWQIEVSLRRRQRERLEAQIQRYELRQRAIEETYRMMDSVDPNNNKWIDNFGRLVEAAMKLNDDSRKEYGDDTKKIDQNVNFSFADLVKIAGVEDTPNSSAENIGMAGPTNYPAISDYVTELNQEIEAEFIELSSELPIQSQPELQPESEPAHQPKRRGRPPQKNAEKSKKVETAPEKLSKKFEKIGLLDGQVSPETEKSDPGVGEDLQESVEYLASTYTPKYGKDE